MSTPKNEPFSKRRSAFLIMCCNGNKIKAEEMTHVHFGRILGTQIVT